MLDHSHLLFRLFPQLSKRYLCPFIHDLINIFFTFTEQNIGAWWVSPLVSPINFMLIEVCIIVQGAWLVSPFDALLTPQHANKIHFMLITACKFVQGAWCVSPFVSLLTEYHASDFYNYPHGIDALHSWFGLVNFPAFQQNVVNGGGSPFVSPIHFMLIIDQYFHYFYWTKKVVHGGFHPWCHQ